MALVGDDAAPVVPERSELHGHCPVYRGPYASMWRTDAGRWRIGDLHGWWWESSPASVAPTPELRWRAKGDRVEAPDVRCVAA